jgi:xanthine dehydrogenase YagS FAD-binding subunit
LAEDFFTPLGNILEPDEMVTGVHLPSPEAGTRGIFQKFTLGNIFDRAVVSVAVVARLEAESCRNPRVVLGAVSPQPWRVIAAERQLEGARLDASSSAKAAQVAADEAWPLERNGYKLDITRILVQRALLALASGTCAPRLPA